MRKIVKLYKLDEVQQHRPLFQPSWNAPHQKNPLLFDISPAEFLLNIEKGVSGGSPAINGRGGGALGGKAAMLRIFRANASGQ